ncbi:MAG: ROK family protein [Methanosarcinaceae archaeon]
MQLPQKGDASLIKNINQQIVLNLIRSKGPISGAELSKITKLQAATVSKIIKNLAEIGFIEIDGRGDSTHLGGKRPTLWRIAPGYGYIIGIEVLPYEIRGSLINLNSEIIVQQTNVQSQKLGGDTVIAAVKKIIDNLISAANVSGEKIIGAGLGVSGLVDSKNGIVRFSIGLNLKEFALKQQMEDLVNTPIVVANDANSAVLGEKWLGLGMDASNMVYITVNEEITGIGCGIILNNELFLGRSQSAGELILDLPQIHKVFSEISPDIKDSPLLNKMGHYLNKISMLELVKDARANGHLALKILDHLGRVLGREVARIISFVNPDMIILGGDISEAKELILNPIKNEVDELVLELPRQMVSITMTQFGRYAVSIGAAALILKEIFREPQVNKKFGF